MTVQNPAVTGGTYGRTPPTNAGCASRLPAAAADKGPQTCPYYIDIDKPRLALTYLKPRASPGREYI